MVKSPKGLKAKIGKHWGLEEDTLCFHFFRGLMITHFCCFSVWVIFSPQTVFSASLRRVEGDSSPIHLLLVLAGEEGKVYGQNRCPVARGWVAREQRQVKASFINWEQQCPLLCCWLSDGCKLPHFEVLELVYGFWPYYLGNMSILVFQFQVVFSSSSHLWEVIFDSWIKPVLRIWHLSLMSWEKWLLQLPPSLRTLMTSSKLSSGMPQRLPLVLLWCVL